jgi:hypothetical protein
MSIVQAPQWEVSQPICGPVIPSCSRSEVDQQFARLGQRLDCFAVDGHLTCILDMAAPPARGPTARATAAAQHDTGEVPLEFDRAAIVLGGRDVALHGGDRGVESGGVAPPFPTSARPRRRTRPAVSARLVMAMEADRTAPAIHGASELRRRRWRSRRSCASASHKHSRRRHGAANSTEVSISSSLACGVVGAVVELARCDGARAIGPTSV